MTPIFIVAIAAAKLVCFIAKDGAKSLSTVLASSDAAIFAPVGFCIVSQKRRSTLSASALKANLLFANSYQLGVSCFALHMARLAKANQIGDIIRFCCGTKYTIWFDVVNSQTVTNMLTAISAIAILLFHYDKPHSGPVASSVCFWATDPGWRVLTTPVMCLPATKALATAVETCLLFTSSFVNHLVGFAFQSCIAPIAFDYGRRKPLGIGFSGVHARFKRSAIGLWLRSALVQYANAYLTSALRRAETRPFYFVERSIKLLTTDFARFELSVFYTHLLIVLEYSGNVKPYGSGTVGYVSLRHGRNFIGIDLNENYLQLARTRIEQSQPMLFSIA